MAMSLWRKLESGEILYRDSNKSDRTYIIDNEMASNIVARNEAWWTIFSPIMIALASAWNPKPGSLWGVIITVFFVMFLTLIFEFASHYFITRNLQRYYSSDANRASQGNYVYPISNKSSRLSIILRAGLATGSAYSIGNLHPGRLYIIVLSIFLIFILYGILKILQIRVIDWSPLKIENNRESNSMLYEQYDGK
jgi:hypothetical protein